jgi:hypothetical protein
MPVAIKKGGLTLPGELYLMTSELAHRRGLEPAEALREALEAALARTPEATTVDEDAVMARVRAIVARAAATRRDDDRADDEILGYPEMFPELYRRK